MMDYEEILSGLSPALRKKLALADELPEIEFAKTPSPSLNKALGGGFAYGRQVLVWGNKSSGKSSMLLQTIAREQSKGKVCAWVDAEASFDAKWAKRLGVDTSKLIVSKAQTVNDMTDVGVQLMKNGVDFITVDSISTLLPAIYFEKDSDELKQLENTKQIGAEARDMTNAVKMLNYANQGNTLLVLISQTRNNIGAMYASLVPTGGKAVQFYSSTIVKLFSSESEAQAIKGDLHINDRVIKTVVGRKVNWDITFNKTAPAFRSGEYNFLFVGDTVGVDVVNDIVDLAIEEGIVTKGGAWFTYGEHRFQGKDKLVDFIKANPAMVAELEARVV